MNAENLPGGSRGSIGSLTPLTYTEICFDPSPFESKYLHGKMKVPNTGVFFFFFFYLTPEFRMGKPHLSL